VWTDVADVAGLTASSGLARDRGFHGRSVVHPRQIAPVNEVFSPRPQEVEDARRLIDSLRRAGDAGNAAWLDGNGRLIDPAVVAQAHWVLGLTAD
jgi:citrate lyase subunit beta/citryl-CoA lyase